MNLEFNPPLGEEGSYITNLLQNFYISIVGKEITATVDKFIITEDENYKEVVQSIDKNSMVTDNSSMVGIAKTIHNPTLGKSTIVIKNHQILPIILGLSSELRVEYWTTEQLDALYTCIHEFGHSKDYSTRYQKPLERPSQPFLFKKVCTYYEDIILGEIAANICISEFIPKSFKSGNSLKEHVNIGYEELRKFVSTRNAILDDIECFRLIGLISVVILKLQEVFIHRSEPNEKLMDLFKEGSLTQIESWIKDLEVNYPNTEDSENNFEGIMRTILNELGFQILEFKEIDIIQKSA